MYARGQLEFKHFLPRSSSIASIDGPNREIKWAFIIIIVPIMLRLNKKLSYSVIKSLFNRRLQSNTNQRCRISLAYKSTQSTASTSKSSAVEQSISKIVRNPPKARQQQNATKSRTIKGEPNEGKKISALALEQVRENQRKVRVALDRRRAHEKISLAAYLRVCVDVGQISRAFNTLTAHSQPSRSHLIDVRHYNIVLRGWARLFSVSQVMETRMHMIRNNVKPNAETFAYILLAHTKSNSAIKNNIKSIIRDLTSCGFTPEQLFQACYMSPSERESVKKILKQVDPKYTDEFCDDPIDYNCKLLENFHESDSVPYNFSGISDLSKLEVWAKEQRNIEDKASIPIRSVAKVKEAGMARYASVWQDLQSMWRKNLLSILDESLLTLLDQAEKSSKIHLYPFICSVDKNFLVDIMLDEIELNATSSSYSISTNSLHINLGRKIMTHYMKSRAQADGSRDELQKLYTEYLREYLTDPDLMSKMNSREFLQVKARETKNYSIYKDRLSVHEAWPQHITAAVGRFCYGLILRGVKFDPGVIRNRRNSINKNNLVYAFYTAYFQVDCGHKIKEEFRAHQDFERLYQRSSSMRMRFDYSFLPSLAPPFPWLSRNLGGYLVNKSDLVRLTNPFEKEVDASESKVKNQKLYPSLDSLNAIGLCPWIVNQEILDLVIHLFQAGGDTSLNVPLEQSKMQDMMPRLKDEPSKSDRIAYNKEKRKYDQKQREMYSLWRDCLYRLSIANHYRNRVIWFPHNMDFRGRTYPIPPHFNHLGADLARSLLLFAKGRPLGDNGLDWLKLHLINLVGNMKSHPLHERLEYANSILHLEVLDSADNPWDGRRWWTRNENPWQVLACCKEIAKAIRSRDHKQYVSHFPVHQDGSCNGLQHYAALGRDPQGAHAVNLVPSERPQDVYSRVVEIVETMRQKDAAGGNKIAQMLDGYIQRKVIKQTVMTNVYGVTRYGARQQIARQLTAKNYSERDVWMAAQYLTAKTFESIGQMFNKSRLIQDWLNNCAYIIASRCRQPVSWETPLGFPITQPYTMPPKHSSSRLLSQTIGADIPLNDPLSQLNASKQKTAFPPNYIHSLDSSHMMLTSLHCQRRGVTFVSVHDCYWSHPSTVDIMNQICRQQFIALHSEPLLEDLASQFMRQFGQTIKRNKTPQATVKKYASMHKELEDHHQLPVESDPFDAELDNAFCDVRPEMSREEIRQNYDRSKRGLVDLYISAREGSDASVRELFKAVPEKGVFDLNQVLSSTYFFS